jgi:MtN3 and saliva related transmembrane protein
MNDEYASYVGIFAGVCTAASMLPQLIKIIRDKKAGEISYLMLIILLSGLAGWIVYGFMKEDYPILVTNSFSFLVNVLIVIFTAKYKAAPEGA